MEQNHKPAKDQFDDNSIKILAWNEHIQRRPEMYIGQIGDGSDPKDGIYTLLKEAFESFLDEYKMGRCNEIVIEHNSLMVSIREYGCGIPLESVVPYTSGMSVGIGVNQDVVTASGIKIANALSESFLCNSYREGMRSWALYTNGFLLEKGIEEDDEDEPIGTWIQFEFDKEIFSGSYYRLEIVKDIIKQYAKQNP